jgi:four helix bundle protein
MDKFRFLNWPAYNSSKELFTLVCGLIRKIPREYRFEFGSQLIRSSFSIILNIAEGSGKNSDRELNRFIGISLGSANETLAGLDVLRDNGFITPAEFDRAYELLDSISNQLGGFKKKLSVMSRKL